MSLLQAPSNLVEVWQSVVYYSYFFQVHMNYRFKQIFFYIFDYRFVSRKLDGKNFIS